MTHAELVNKAYQWVLKSGSCGVAFKEFRTHNSTGEQPDVIGFGSGGHSIVIEVKVSRSDFLADRKKIFRSKPAMGMGRSRYYCCPSGLIKKEELPEGWGLLQLNHKNQLTKVHRPVIMHPNPAFSHMIEYHHECNKDAEMAMMYSALRRLEIRGAIKSIYNKIPKLISHEINPPIQASKSKRMEE